MDPLGNPPQVTCERCGTSIPCRPEAGRHRLREFSAIGLSPYNNIKWYAGSPMDICKNCHVAFRAWLDQKEAKPSGVD